MIIKMTITQPIYVSGTPVFDILNIGFKEKDLFRSTGDLAIEQEHI